MRGGDDIMDSLVIWLFSVGLLRFSVTLNGFVLMGCEVVAVALVDLTLKVYPVTFAIVERFSKSENMGGTIIC